MAVGQGSVITQQKKEPAGNPAPPFAANSADNGLSVDPIGGEIVLGDLYVFGGGGTNNAVLLSDRQINFTAGFALHFVETQDSDEGITFTPVARQINIDSRVPGVVPKLVFNEFNSGNSGRLQFDGTSFLLTNGILALDILMNSQLSLGDTTSAGNGTMLSIDDAIETTLLGDPNFIEPVMEIRGSVGGNPLIDLFVPDAGGNYADISVFNNGAHNITMELFGVNDYAIDFISEDGVTGDYFRILERAGTDQKRLFIDFLNDIFQFGDIDGSNNGNFLEIDDNNNVFKFDNTASNAGISINGVVGFTGTVAPVNTITVNNGIVTNVA